MSIEERNARITSVSMSTADHGCLSSRLNLDYGGLEQVFGSYVLYIPKHMQGNYAGMWIWRCLESAGVSDWKDLPGKIIRVRTDHTKIHAIGHVLEDRWFYPEKEFIELERVDASTKSGQK